LKPFVVALQRYKDLALRWPVPAVIRVERWHREAEKLELRFRFYLALVFDFFRAREVGGAGEGAGVLLLT
jgi:hypothetical protein